MPRPNTSIDVAHIVILDSLSHLTSEHKGKVVVCGSHCGNSAAKHALSFQPAAVFCSDAGEGKENAGIEGLELFDEQKIPAAAVDIWSARIGDGRDTYESGVLSSINGAAERHGLSVGTTVREAVRKLIKSGEKS